MLVFVLGVDIVEKTEKITAFGKNDSACLKGVAILILMVFHCFGDAGRFKGYEFNFSPFGQDLFVDLALYCRICVSIFAFISGYGLYLSVKNKTNSINETNKWVALRYIKTLSGFWIWYVICFVFMYFFNGLPKEIYFGKGIVRGSVYVLFDFLGLGKVFGTPLLNSAWWYMGAAVVYIALMPLLVRWTDKWGWFSLFTAIVIIPRLILDNEYVGTSSIITFILPVYFGALFAEFGLFEKIERISVSKNKFLNEFLLLFGGILVILVSIYIWIRVPYKVLWEYSFGVAPVLLIIFLNRFVFRQGGRLRKSINTVFSFFGKYSMDIYIFHTFIRAHILRDFLYSMGYPVLTILSLFFISLVVALVFGLFKKLIKYDGFISWLEKKAMSLFPASN